MGDYRIFVDNLRLSYEGAFEASHLFRTIFTYLFDKGYDSKPLKEFQYDTPTGKAMEWQASPWKKITDYMRLEGGIRVIITDMVKKEMVLNGRKMLVDHGKVLIILNWYMETDYDMRWEDRPMFQFIRVLYDKWVFKDYTQRYEFICADHANQLYALLRRLFNTYSTHGMQTLPNSIALHD
jgi:hypothetical protein